MTNEDINPETDETVVDVSTDGRSIEDFQDLEELRNEMASRHGKRAFSRAKVGAVMGVPGPTVMRVERVTARTTAQELEDLEVALLNMDASATETAELDADDEADTDE